MTWLPRGMDLSCLSLSFFFSTRCQSAFYGSHFFHARCWRDGAAVGTKGMRTVFIVLFTDLHTILLVSLSLFFFFFYIPFLISDARRRVTVCFPLQAHVQLHLGAGRTETQYIVPILS